MSSGQLDRRATWKQALFTFFSPIVLLLSLRWLLIEPYVIPSGSMIPTLLIHDHILVNKLAYGIHVPFSRLWVAQWSSPKRFDIVVFRYPQTPDLFYVKRVVGVSGDRIAIREGKFWINGEEVPIEEIRETVDAAGLQGEKLNAEDDEAQNGGLDVGFGEPFRYFKEGDHVVRYQSVERANSEEFIVPEGHFFVVGDNRDQSHDSRFWGSVPEDHLLGRAAMVWLSCEETLPTASFLCDPKTLRWERIFRSMAVLASPTEFLARKFGRLETK